jgi:elongation factor P
MITSNQITPGMTIRVDSTIYRVESSVKVTVAKGSPFVKTKLRDLTNDEVIEKNFKLNQNVEEVFLEEHHLEFLYPEGKNYLFLDVDSLEKILVPSSVLSAAIHYLKEGIQVKALFYSDTIFSIELPQFLELMVVKTEAKEEKGVATGSTKKAVLETGATIDVPLFIESGDVIKVDVHVNGYIQRV